MPKDKEFELTVEASERPRVNTMISMKLHGVLYDCYTERLRC